MRIRIYITALAGIAIFANLAFASPGHQAMTVSAMIASPKVIFGLISLGLLVSASQRPRHGSKWSARHKRFLSIVSLVSCAAAMSFMPATSTSSRPSVLNADLSTMPNFTSSALTKDDVSRVMEQSK